MVGDADVLELVGQTITELKGLKKGQKAIEFVLANGLTYKMSHACYAKGACYSVQAIEGDVKHLTGAPILSFVWQKPEDEDDEDPNRDNAQTIETKLGKVVIRWGKRVGKQEAVDNYSYCYSYRLSFECTHDGVSKPGEYPQEVEYDDD